MARNPSEQKNRPQLAPYKLILGNERITDENAPISFLEPDHPLLNVPNKLNQDDFRLDSGTRTLLSAEWDPQFRAAGITRFQRAAFEGWIAGRRFREYQHGLASQLRAECRSVPHAGEYD